MYARLLRDTVFTTLVTILILYQRFVKCRKNYAIIVITIQVVNL